MTWIDAVLWAVLLGFAIKGFLKGLVREVCSLAALAVGGWAAFRYYPALAAALERLIHLPERFLAVLAFVLVFLGVGILFFLLGHLLTVVFKVAMLGWLNRAGGVLFGLLQGGVLLCILLYLATSKPVPDKVRQPLLHAPTAKVLVDAGHDVLAGWEAASRPASRRPAAK